MIAQVSRTPKGILLTITAQSEVEGIALDAWAEEHPFNCERTGLLIVGNPPTGPDRSDP